MQYNPKPINAEHITLPDWLQQLQERLAENAHDVWAAKRIAQGWRYGTQRNDDRKEHPCLVPYADLSESEKDLDRLAVTQTLKTLLAMGYKITDDGK